MNSLEIIEDYYRAHRSEVLEYVNIRLHNSDEAEDMVQEVFLRLLCGNRPISQPTLPNLVYTLCRNMIVDKSRWVRVRQDSEHELSRLQGNAESAESILSVHEINEQLERGLMHVPAEGREFYRMHIYGGMQAQDISLQTGEKYSTVEYRLGQARRQVRNYIRKIS